MSDLAGQVRDLLAQRDRARRGQLFRPDRAVIADDAFVAAVVKLAEDHAASVLPVPPAKVPARRPAARKAPG